jgi:hypothetical protein
MFGGLVTEFFCIHFITVHSLLRHAMRCTGYRINDWGGTGSQIMVLNVWLGACVLSCVNTASNRTLFGCIFVCFFYWFIKYVYLMIYRESLTVLVPGYFDACMRLFIRLG